VVIALIDHLTGYEIGFFVFYFIPVGLAAWAGGRRIGLVLAFTCAVVWLVVDLTTAHPYSSGWYRYENALSDMPPSLSWRYWSPGRRPS
jgi:hypothetical protein